MSSSVRKEKTSRTPHPTHGHRHEVLGILFAGLAAFLSLILFSYSPQDPSFNSSAIQSTIKNKGGVFGAYVAEVLFQGLGMNCFLLIPLALWLGITCFRNQPESFQWRKAVLLSSFLALLATFIQLTFSSEKLEPHYYPGGLIGYFLASPLESYFNLAGAYLILVLLSLLTFVWGTGISITKSMQWWARFCRACLFKIKALAYHSIERIQLSVKQWQQEKAKRKTILVEKPGLLNPTPKITAPKLKLVEQPKLEKPPAPTTETLEQEPKISFREDSFEEESAEPSSIPSISELMRGFLLPSMQLLDDPEKPKAEIDLDALKQNSKILEKNLRDYGVEGRVTEIHPGPVVTMYEFEPAAGVKVSKIVNLEADLSLTMGGRSVRIVSHLQGKAAVGIEIPNEEREIVYLKEILSDSKFQKAESKLSLALGKDIEGVPFVTDLQKMPHLLVAGATGTGKSVCLNAMILSLLYKATPEEVRFIFVDPKMLELSIYQGIPHLLLPVVTEPKKAAIALKWAVAEMERRYKLMSSAQTRNLAGYNKKFEKGLLKDQKILSEGHESSTLKHDQKLPLIVIIIDELADLMMVAGREVEEYITRLAQMARAAGIHLILATQRPSVDVITGIIKANFPARVSFKVSSTHDSRTIIDGRGAETLLGMGDMLFLPPGVAKLARLHGAYVSDAEVTQVVEHLKKQGQPVYDESILQYKETKEEELEEFADDLYDQAVSIVTETRQASISMVQRRLRIGYNRAARMIERMEREGVVGPSDGVRGREVLVSSFQES